MAEEPPPEFVEFVAAQLPWVQSEASRLTGGSAFAEEVYPAVFSDVALHWRRLAWRRRLTGRDEATAYLRKRLHARTEQWREDQIYEVEVEVLRRPAMERFVTASVALLKAKVLPDTHRAYGRPMAEAAIAWEHAWRRARNHRLARMAAGTILAFGAAVQLAENLPSW